MQLTLFFLVSFQVWVPRLLKNLSFDCISTFFVLVVIPQELISNVVLPAVEGPPSEGLN